MKNHLLKIFILNILLVLTTLGASAQDKYDWLGNNNNTNNWADPTNWQKNGATQTSSGTAPGNLATDQVYIGVNFNYNFGGHTYNPNIATNTPITITSLTFGNNLRPTSATNNGGRSDMGITVGSSTTTSAVLNVTGTFLQMHSNTGGTAYSGGTDITGATAGTIINAIKTTIQGYGTIHCGYFQVGDNTLPGNPFVINNTNVTVGTSTTTNNTIKIVIDNDLILNSKSTNSKTVPADDLGGDESTRNSNASLDFNSGTITVGGAVKISNTDYKGYVLTIYAASVTFKVYTTGSTAPTLNLAGPTPLQCPAPPPVYAANVIDFIIGSTSPYPTVNYTGTSNQVVYAYNATGYPERYIDFAGSVIYGNIGFSGSGNKVLEAGPFGIYGSFTLAAGMETVDLSTNKPVLKVPGNFSTGTGSTFTNGTVASGCSPIIIGGNFNNDGTCNFSDPLVTFNSTAAATFTATVPVTFTNVKFDGGGLKSMTNGSYNVVPTGILTMGTTATQLAAGGFLTLRSDSTGSATVAKITAGSITGNVNVQRFLSAVRGYRFLSSPVDSVAGSNYYSINYIRNTAFVTGTGGTGAGFDKAGNPTLYLYREDVAPLYTTFLNSNFRGVNTLNSAPNYSLDLESSSYTIPSGNGFLFYFRGDRNLGTLAGQTTAGAAATFATFTATGVLNQGTIPVTYWYNNSTTLPVASPDPTVAGWYLIGNPYASSIDWNTYGSGITGTNLLNAEYTLNETNHNYGAYQGGLATNGGSNLIASGQGFFILVNPTKASGSITFNEGAKTTSQLSGSSLFMGKPVAENTLQYIRLQLVQNATNTDEMVIGFNSNANTTYAANEDAPYKTGQGLVNLCSYSSDHVALAINQVPFAKNMQPIALKVGAATDGTYQLNLSQEVAVPPLYDIWLMDTFKKDSINLRINKTYSFNILKSDTNTYGSKRFVLFMRQNPNYAYKLVSFNAQRETHKVSLVWTTQNEANYTHFTVLRSTDGGKNFDVLGGTTSSDQGTYSLDDNNPVTGANLYKLQQVDVNDNITFSNIVTVLYSNAALNAGNKISVYPNPAVGPISLSVPTNKDSGNFNIRIVNSSGVVVKQVASAQNQWQGNVSNLLTGTYIIEVVNNKDKSLVGQAKLVKL